MMILAYPKLTIYEAEAFHAQLLELIKQAGDVTFDFTSVQKIDMTAIQLLISFKKSCVSQKKNLIFENVQTPVMDSFTLSGASTYLGVKHD